MWQLAGDVGLDVNSPYAYVLWAEYFGATSLVATDASRRPRVVAFVIGFRPPADPHDLFVWQIGVHGAMRGGGVGSQLLDRLTRLTSASHLVATVTPENQASAALFRTFAARHGAPVTETPLFGAELFPGGHEPEVRFRIGPIDRPEIDHTTEGDC